MQKHVDSMKWKVQVNRKQMARKNQQDRVNTYSLGEGESRCEQKGLQGNWKLWCWPSTSTPWYLLKRNENMFTKDWYKNIHSSCIKRTSDLNNPGTSIEVKKKKKKTVYLYNVILLSHKKGWNTDTQNTMNVLKHIVLSERSLTKTNVYCVILFT